MDDSGSQGGQQFSLTASKGAKGVGSRTAILDGKTIWSEDDKIYVSSEDGRVTGVLKLDPNSLSEDKTTATFTGFVFGDPAKLAYSVFPAPTNGNIIDLSTIEGGKEVDAPFIGKIDTSEDVDVRFDHVCGVAPIVKNNYQGGDIAITATNDNNPVKFLSKLDVTNVEFINGKPEFIIGNDEIEIITITSPKGGQMYVPYYLKSTLTANGEGKKIVEFKHGNDVVNNADLTDGFVGKVHATTVVAHTMKEDGTTVQNTSTESTLSADEKTALVDQNQFSSINSEESATSEETQYFNVSGLVEKTEEGKTQNVVAEAVEVTLPKVEVTEENKDVEKSVEISFTNITSSTTITIKEEAPTTDSEQQKKSIENLTVVLPSGTTAEEAKEAVNINMPNTTVTVKSDDGQILLIEYMTAATADNTLVVGADVEIKSLTIKKGNVQVFGKVGEIKRADDNDDKETVVTIEKGGEVNAVFGKDKINVIDNNKPSETPEQTTVSYFKELKAALADAEPKIKLGDDIVLEEPLSIIAETEIDLNGKTLSVGYTDNKGKNAVITCSEALILRNGNLTGGKTSDLHDYYISMSGGAHKQLLLTNVSLSTGTGIANAVFMDDDLLMTGSSSKITTSGNAIHYVANQSGPRYYSRIYGTVNGDIYIESTHKTLNAMLIFEGGTINGNLVKGASSNASLNLPEYVFNNGAQVGAGYAGWENIGVYVEEGSDKPEGGDHVAEGTPVADLNGLQAILEDPDNRTNIILTAPIVLTQNYAIDLGGRILFIDENIFANHPDATAAISSTANLTIQNATIYGPELKEAETQRYMIEHVGSTSQITTLTISSVTLESRGMARAVHVKDGYLYLEDSNIEAGIAFNLEADGNTVKGHINEKSQVSNRILFTHNHGGETNIDLNMSGLYIESGANINSSLEVDGTYAENLELYINKNESQYYGYDNIIGEGWFDATVNYLQYQLKTTGLVEIAAWDLKEDIVFEVNRDEAPEKTIRFYVKEELGGNGKIKFKNTGTKELTLMYTLPDDRFTCEGSFGEPTKVDW